MKACQYESELTEIFEKFRINDSQTYKSSNHFGDGFILVNVCYREVGEYVHVKGKNTTSLKSCFPSQWRLTNS